MPSKIAEKPKGEAPETEAIIDALFCEAWKPKENLGIVRWAEKYIGDIPYSPIPGRFHVANSPMIRQVMEAIVNPKIKSVITVACVQSGKTLAPEIALAYLIVNEPGATIWLDMTDAQAKDQAEGRLRPLFENIEPVREFFNPDKNKMRNTTMIFSNGMTLWVLGAKNKRNLQRRSLRYVFGDETWLWEPGRMREAEARTTAFRNGKCIFMSQGSFDGDDTDKKFQASSKNEWCFQCPECGQIQPFVWKNLEWDKTPDGVQNIRLVCEKCQHEFPDSEDTRRTLNATGRFVANAPEQITEQGFHWNALATMPWRMLINEYLLAKRSANRGDIADLMAFYQKRLAVAWKDDKEDEELLSPSIPIGNYSIHEAGTPFHWEQEAKLNTQTGKIIPAETPGFETMSFPPLRFLTVDVQEGYFYFVVRAWTAEGSSRLVDYGMLQFLGDIAKKAQEHSVISRFVFIDCGFDTDRVLQFCAEHDFTALRGASKTEWVFRTGGFQYVRYYSPRESVRCGNGKIARRHYFSNLRCKDILATLRSGRASATWEVPIDAKSNYTKQLNSEQRDNKLQRWVQINRRPNHFFDCETMNVCGALMLGIVGLQKEGEKQ